MYIIQDPANSKPCVLVLGMFDGVHRGHQSLLMAGLALAHCYGLPLTVCTFEPHPLSVLRPQQAPVRLTSAAERARLMALYGVDCLSILRFTRELSGSSPEEFLDHILQLYHPRAVLCGFNYTFGRKGKGDGRLLKAWGKANGIRVEILPEVTLLGATVSSTRIRSLLESGDVESSNCLLGHAWTLCGTAAASVNSMGLPSVRIRVRKGQLLPADGMYACYLSTRTDAWPMLVQIAAQNGDSQEPLVEAYSLGELPMLPEQPARLSFYHCIRLHPSGQACSCTQLQQDIEKSIAYFRAIR